MLQLQQLQWNGNIPFAPGIAGQVFINPINGQIRPQGNIPIPPLETPPEKTDAEDDAPSKDKKTDKTEPKPDKEN
jgi:hypothetical protein